MAITALPFRMAGDRRDRPIYRMTYEVKIEKPPIWNDICFAFGIIPQKVLFTYGDTIYNPDNVKIPDDIIEHEKVHMEQQNHNVNDAALWWGKFLRDPAFRVDQESKAYAVQYRFVCKFVTDRNQRFNFRMELARLLSGPLYGNSISQKDAEKLIYKLSGVK